MNPDTTFDRYLQQQNIWRGDTAMERPVNAALLSLSASDRVGVLSQADVSTWMPEGLQRWQAVNQAERER